VSNRLIKLLVVDDHQIVRKGIISLLSKTNGIKVIAEAANGEDAIRSAREHQPDVILMDLNMPGMGGLEATHQLLRIMPDVRILALTICDSDVFPTRFLEEGASGYITKDCSKEEIVNAIRSVYAGQRYISPEIAQKLALKRYAKKEALPFDSLSERELQVMLMITKGERVQNIAEVLHLSPKTVNTYRYRIFDKLGVGTDVELTHLALRYGLIDNN
jgi:two-component system, NarL family, invasion response regulator UvrY